MIIPGLENLADDEDCCHVDVPADSFSGNAAEVMLRKLKYTFAEAKAPGQKKTQYFEVMGDRAIYHDGWIASAWGPRIPWVAGLPASISTWSPDNDTWLLYNLNTDFSQSTDFAANEPKRLADMKQLFGAQALDNKVYPVGGGLWSVVWSPQSAPQNPATEFDYTQHVVAIPEPTGPKLGARSSRVETRDQ